MKSYEFRSFACFCDKFRTSFVQVSLSFADSRAQGTTMRPSPVVVIRRAVYLAVGGVLNQIHLFASATNIRIDLSKNCGWAARNTPCEKRRTWHFSNRWMSFILPVWHRTQNATTATRIDSPPSPRAQCWRLPLRRGGCVRLHKYCQSTLSCRGEGGALAGVHYAHAFGLCGARLLVTGNINTIHRLDGGRDGPAISGTSKSDG